MAERNDAQFEEGANFLWDQIEDTVAQAVDPLKERIAELERRVAELEGGDESGSELSDASTEKLREYMLRKADVIGLSESEIRNMSKAEILDVIKSIGNALESEVRRTYQDLIDQGLADPADN